MRHSFPLLLMMSMATILAAQPPSPGTTDTVLIPGTGIRFVLTYIPAGPVVLQEGKDAVAVDGFWMGKYEVTQEEFLIYQYREHDSEANTWKDGEFSVDAVTRPSPPYVDITFGMGSGGRFPAVSMTHQSAMFYCYWLYTKTGQFFRLPTEAEWTHACLAGSKGNWPENVSAETLDDFSWNLDNSGERYREVGGKKPNPWGLYDMLGNVSEWTLDQYNEDLSALSGNNPWLKPEKRHGRTVKGASFDDAAAACDCRHRVRSSAQWQKRDPQIPKSLWWNTDASFVGFRLIRPLTPPKPEEIEAFFQEAIKW